MLRDCLLARWVALFFDASIVRTSAGGFSLPSASNSKLLLPTSIEKKPAGKLSSCSEAQSDFLRFNKMFLSVTCALCSHALSTARRGKEKAGVPRHHFRTSKDSKGTRCKSHRGRDLFAGLLPRSGSNVNGQSITLRQCARARTES